MLKMKDSGIEWIGEIPETWEKVKFNAIYSNRNTKVSDREYAPLSVTKKGIVPQLATAAKTNDNDNRKLVKSGDFVINSRSDRRGSCGISSLDGSVSLINTVLEPKNSQMDPLYFDFLFHTIQFADEFYKWGHGIVDDLWTTNWNDMKNITLILPTRSEQQLIADFLDHKTVEIDGLIDKINTEIDTLKQYQSSVITQAVTKGLDPNVPMKDSGIEWIGEIPETWKMVKIKHLVNTVNLKDKLSNLNSRYIGLENAEKGTGKLIMTETTYPDEIYKICKKGNVLYSKLRPNLAKVLIAPFDSCCTSEFEVLNTFNNRWIKYCLLSNGITEMTTAATYGVKMPRVNWEEVSNYKIPVPKNDEIEFINNYIDSKMLTVDNLIKQKQQQINQLTEYKNSLIFEYVTGKKQVKEAN
ncbi:restriction endonuclease subunit S [Ligilactobacillus salivarius]|uniref:restriction endonuclease subunit S n=1 Tax=Ligilactobacillus salivarius TaxID=1624 RepID=UPI00191FA580|nr:restriction endonuclease subunit S [Ligilactobacillus salivarius]MBL1070921.1 restriction endonuclease subunit S [Ligilactobacillus salivarius]